MTTREFVFDVYPRATLSTMASGLWVFVWDDPFISGMWLGLSAVSWWLTRHTTMRGRARAWSNWASQDPK